MTKEMMKADAVKRLDYLTQKGLHYNVMADFRDRDLVNYSEFNGLCGAIYWFNEDGGAKPEWMKLVKDFEERTGNLVYHITHEHSNFGELLDLFIVSKYEEDWNYERDDLYNGAAYCYVINLDEPDFSEFGAIGIRVLGGGIIRIS